MKRLLKDKRGEGFVDVCVLVLAIAMVLALVVRIAPVFVAKQNLDVFADELVRTAEINGQVALPQTQKQRICGSKPDSTPISHGATPEKSSSATRWK